MTACYSECSLESLMRGRTYLMAGFPAVSSAGGVHAFPREFRDPAIQNYDSPIGVSYVIYCDDPLSEQSAPRTMGTENIRGALRCSRFLERSPAVSPDV